MSQEQSNGPSDADKDNDNEEDSDTNELNTNEDKTKSDKIFRKGNVQQNSNDDEKKYESNVKKNIPQNLEPKELGQKNKIVIGTFEPSTFHYSFKNQKDPLQIGMFPVFGYVHIPHIGVYGDSYEPTQLKVLLELSMNDKLISNLPKSVIGAIEEIMEKTNIGKKERKISDIFEGYVIIHDCPPYAETQHFSMNANNLFNVMYHSWFYNKIEDLSNDQQIEGSLMCGLFEAYNVYEIRNDPQKVKSTVDRGIPFNRLEERSCFLHGFAFSPCNCDIARDAQSGYCSFYMVSCTKDYGRACLSYHVFANNQDMDDILKWSLKQIQTVKQLVTAFNTLQWGNIHTNLQFLCTHY